MEKRRETSFIFRLKIFAYKSLVKIKHTAPSDTNELQLPNECIKNIRIFLYFYIHLHDSDKALSGFVLFVDSSI